MRQTLRHLATIVKAPTQRKHAYRWLRSLRQGFLLDEPSPWITFDAIDYVQEFIERRAAGDRAEPLRVFEYGSGGSTRFWLSRGARCVSIEHDPAWFEVVRARIGSASVDYRLIEPEPTGTDPGDPADPEAYASGDAGHRRSSFRRYASAIDEFPSRHFDIVLVDGRSRPACVKHAVDKVRPGGLLILDNAEVEYYTRIVGARLGSFRRLSFVGALPTSFSFTRTDVYVNGG
jgi:hypothetical protein